MYNNIRRTVSLDQIHTGLGIMKPENKFQKLMKKDIQIAAI